ncbi:hypothetical protein YPPY56_1907, partial [Yersinia pestis PY-56]
MSVGNPAHSSNAWP